MEYYENLILDYPIYSIEDPLDEEDWDGWSRLTMQESERRYSWWETICL